MKWKQWMDVQNSLAANQGETFPSAFLLCVAGGMYPASRCVTWQGKILEADGSWAAPGLVQRWRCRGAAAGGHLNCLISHVQVEVVQGLLQNGVGVVVEKHDG
jgi:hypothetical protein